MKTAEEILQDKGTEMICVDYNTVICDALKLMTENRIGAVLIKKNEKIAGIWTERDLMRNCLGQGFDAKKDIIGDFMSTNLHSAKHSANVYELMDIFLGKRMRHLLIEKDGKYIGILSSGDVMRATMLEKDEELKRLNAMVSWEYYENWKWERTQIPPIIHNKEGLRIDR
ncbi:MAG: CBS domain-containing protein [Candidatus Aminicenantes bacterium]|nr:CBS domain-containing protein [Candidatus Aminicenantes bacterium]NIM82777.1 CBS domain-containing protein [Candidatus Aminicenantes bacterium]NIN22152.1 CBS domain-containing protein [Candidatus Aminicenantes bacterium]NIN41149.1 CBS domain-containing protein [Candidatus Aminicenantes bacterium]NIN88748.1 CBS domain-containing protein [Candidatus Aminicenantes bacterium]